MDLNKEDLDLMVFLIYIAKDTLNKRSKEVKNLEVRENYNNLEIKASKLLEKLI